MIRPQRNVKFLPQTEKWFVGDDACIVPNDGLYRIYYHIIPRMTVGAQCVPLWNYPFWLACCNAAAWRLADWNT